MSKREKMWNGLDEDDHKVQEAWEAIRKSKRLKMFACKENKERLTLRTDDKEIVMVRDHDEDIVYRCVKGKMEGGRNRKVNSERGGVRSLRAEAKYTGDLPLCSFQSHRPKEETFDLEGKGWQMLCV